MADHRFFLEAPLSEAPGPALLPLSSGDLHHAVSVLRLGAGSVVSVVEPSGAVWSARIDTATHDGLLATVLEELPAVEPCRVTLFQGVAKGAKVDLVVEKVTELNVEAIVPVLTERSVVRLSGDKAAERGARWRRVAQAAAKQSQRASVPLVSDPVGFDGLLAALSRLDVTLVVWAGAMQTGIGIGEALDEAGAVRGSRVGIVVGPEGGLTAEEVYRLEAAGARAVSLGDTVLRSETAGVVATAICAYELGALGGRSRG